MFAWPTNAGQLFCTVDVAPLPRIHSRDSWVKLQTRGKRVWAYSKDLGILRLTGMDKQVIAMASNCLKPPNTKKSHNRSTTLYRLLSLGCQLVRLIRRVSTSQALQGPKRQSTGCFCPAPPQHRGLNNKNRSGLGSTQRLPSSSFLWFIFKDPIR